MEDLLSPPCVATIFTGDNGGSTSMGVSSTEIRIGVPSTGREGTTGGYWDAVQGLFEFFNRRFEFYGRHLVPVFVPGTAVDAPGARALGASTAAAGVFGAVTGLQDWDIREPQLALVQELARNRVVTVVQGGMNWWSDRLLYDPYHPYVWSVEPSAEHLQANLAAAACALAGKPAHGPGGAGLVRRFGILAGGRLTPPAVGSLAEVLTTCTGVDPVRVAHSSVTDGSVGFTTAAARFMEAGVTTVICACEGRYFTTTRSIRSASFDPEWIIGSSNSWTEEADTQTLHFTSPAVSTFIQVQPGPRIRAVQERAWFGALLETNPTLLSGPSGLQAAFVIGEFLYEQLLLLASGIQGAGPALTPDAFAQAVMTMQFPNPGAGRAPGWQPAVGFGPGDHALYDDYAVSWFSDTAPAIEPYSGRPLGSWCYVGAGERFRPGTYPANLHDRLFNPAEPCR